MRLMAGAVNRSTMKELQKTVQASPASYPWQAVVERVLAEPIDPEELSTQALKSQRDWVVRGGRETPGKGVSYHAKSFVARMVARLIFFGMFVVCAVLVLVLVKARWPEFDIYRLTEWLQRTWPGTFGPR